MICFWNLQRLFFVVCLDQLADQRCSLPVFAKQQTFSRRVRNSQRASSKLSMVLTTGNFACRMLRSMARRSRPDNSNSAMLQPVAGIVYLFDSALRIKLVLFARRFSGWQGALNTR